MKKYHHRPTLGVRSGSRRWTPYVDMKNSVEPPVIRSESPKRAVMTAKNRAVCLRVKF